MTIIQDKYFSHFKDMRLNLVCNLHIIVVVFNWPTLFENKYNVNNNFKVSPLIIPLPF
jgi:hypothetical protein